MLSHVRLFANPWTVAHQALLFILQVRQQEWVAFSPTGYLPDPGIKAKPSALAGGFFTTEPPGKPPYPEILPFKSEGENSSSFIC